MLWQRVITAIVLVAVLAVVLFGLPQVVSVAVLFGLALAGAWEWSAFAGLTRPVARGLYVAGCALLMALLWRATGSTHGLQLVLFVTLAWWAVAFLWLLLAPTRGGRVGAGIAGWLALAPFGVALARVYLAPGNGAELVVFALLLAWAADVGAYFAGRALGRVKLAPRVSPNKTWEGLVGGLVLGVAVALLARTWFGFPAAVFLPLCVGAVLISVVGDLTESMFKRQAGLKDSGRLLPGHGGLLDRIDSLTASVPLLALGLSWLGAIP